MADIAAAREEIQKVVALLVSRFGHESDVFAHLTLALSHLREEPPKPIVEETVAVTAPEPLEVAATAEPESEIVESPPEEPPQAKAVSKQARRQWRKEK